MLTPEAQAEIDERREQRQAVIRGDAPLTRLGARTIGDMALLEVGCTIWGKTEGTEARMTLNAPPDAMGNPAARGGIVVEITDETSVTEDGEIVRQRAFRTLDYTQRVCGGSWSVLTEAQVDLASCEAPVQGRIRSLYRRLCTEVGGRRGVAHSEEIDMVIVAARLAATVGQRR